MGILKERIVIAQIDGLTIFKYRANSPITFIESADGSIISMVETHNGGISISADSGDAQTVTARTVGNGRIRGIRVDRH